MRHFGKVNKFGFMALVIVTTLCSFPADAQDIIHVKGSSTIGPAAKYTFSRLAAANGLTVIVEGGGSAVGLKCPLDNGCDVGLASKSVSGDAAKGLKVIHYGWDGLAFVANRKANITKLTSEQIRDIYSGKLKNWKEVGGAELPITAYGRSPEASEHEFFENYFHVKPVGEDLGATEAVINKVSHIEGTIGFMSLGLAQKATSNLTLVTLDNIPASSMNVKNKSYKFVRELVLLVRSARSNEGNLKKTIDILLEDRAQVFERFGFML